ncbi:tRNA/rRNA methyltransferase [Flammeovirgaceae bacterium SG7u.111]|nr:tRNA/rRNA methyltransferase [Flammeovirgaceae bacterium SG7u.132]WPO36559.1 tRNA/rRNA methyltransferase [Flammeovirgaceae bacterium SG7u.111]
MELHFILVEPAVPENVGSAARAMKAMGFRNMRVVNSQNHLSDKAMWQAHGSTDVLEEVEVFDTVEAAVKDMDFVVATSAKRVRKAKAKMHSADGVLLMLKDKKHSAENIGLVFGSEENGLTEDDLKLCDVVSSIPLYTQYPSINLSQAVMIYAYVFSPLVITSKAKEVAKTGGKYPELKEKVERLIASQPFTEKQVQWLWNKLPTLNDTDISMLLEMFGGE